MSLRAGVSFKRTDVGQKVVGRVFGINPDFDRVPVYGQLVLCIGYFFPFGNFDLQLYQINPCDCFRHRVLDLQSRVHLQEVEVQLLIHNELDCSCVVISAGLCNVDSRSTHGATNFRSQYGRRRFLYYFLMPPLNRTLAFEQMDNISMLIAENLDFNVPWFRNVFLNKHGPVPKR
jgi:hypothetical protein